MALEGSDISCICVRGKLLLLLIVMKFAIADENC